MSAVDATGSAAETGSREPRRTVVIGAGALGLAVAEGMAARGRAVTVLEGAAGVGGVLSPWTIATSEPPEHHGDDPSDEAAPSVTWDRFYHVVLSADTRTRALVEGLGGRITFETVGSQMLAGGRLLPMSSPLDLLRLPSLPLLTRFRVAVTILVGGLLPLGSAADQVSAGAWLRRWSGRAGYERLWGPLLRAKLGSQADAASSVFIRSTFRRLLGARLRGVIGGGAGGGDRFGWIEGGYASVLQAWSDRVSAAGVGIETGVIVTTLTPTGDAWLVEAADGTSWPADEVVVTTPAAPAARLLGTVDPDLASRLAALPQIGCVCTSVVLSRPVTSGYLTYVTDTTPYTAIVEMSNLTGTAAFGRRSLVYLPRYADPTDAVFDTDPDATGARFVADLISRVPGLAPSDVLGVRTAAARHVMPVPLPGARGRAPAMRSSAPGVYLASSAHITTGTLNVESTLEIAQRLLATIDADARLPQRTRTP